MRTILEQYGTAILAVLSALAILGLIAGMINKNGVLHPLLEKGLEGDRIENPGDAGGDPSFSAMQASEGKSLPDIHVEEKVLLHHLYQSQDLIQTGTGNSARVGVRFLRIWNFQGADLTGQLLQPDGKIVFKDEGVYRARVFLDEENGGSGAVEIYLGVSA
ncbi:MAG: hypothetical protein PUE58_05855 [Lachnospiraceae bacterium]|nr:hypothetical protein [Lachnospiraceae bacterium]